MSDILIFGGGQVSQGLQRALHDTDHSVRVVTSDTIDYSDSGALWDYMSKVKPQIVINAVAFTDVAGAEKRSNQIKCTNLNTLLPLILQSHCRNLGAEFVHFSTNFVFDGETRTPYTEDATTNPLQFYGKTKEAADILLGTCKRRKVKIFRLACVYSNHGKSFVTQIEDRMTDQYSIDVVSDQIMTPTHSDWIGEIVVKCLDKPSYGIFNLVPDGHCSYADFAKKIVDGRCQINPITSFHFATSVQRPLYAVLDNSKIKTTFELEFPTWEQVYDRYKF
jgi:dTDP-4-dehydrorhamnose reductase